MVTINYYFPQIFPPALMENVGKSEFFIININEWADEQIAISQY